MDRIRLDIRRIETPEAVQIYVQYAMRFPPHYGRNLDAMYDMLTQIGRDTEVEVRCGRAMCGRMGAYWPRMRRVLEDAARENGHLRVKITEE